VPVAAVVLSFKESQMASSKLKSNPEKTSRIASPDYGSHYVESPIEIV
jgi:hypothetical protein